jgi:hypothetical protein
LLEDLLMRRTATVSADPGEGVRVPSDCLAELGLGEGARVVVEAIPGRLLLTPYWDVQAVGADLGEIARDLEEVRGRLLQLAGLLPETAVPEAAESALGPLKAESAGADLLGTLECILADDLEPALAKLQEAVALTRELGASS